MIIYEVNHNVAREIAKEYTEWLNAHIQQMLSFEGFESVDWYTLAGDDGDPKVHWCLHYHVRSMADLTAYFKNHAEKMKADGASRFGDRYATDRRILSPYGHFA